jgi:cytoskeleton protein RodZ
MRVSSELKAARKKAGISVDMISTQTKIKASKLVALENADFKNLPTGLYLFSMVRAYAREVHIDPEPIVERLRAEFAEKDALDALHTLDAAGALDAKSSANVRRSTEKRSNLFSIAAVATGVMLIAAAGTGAYLYVRDGTVHEVRSTKAIRSSDTPTVNSPNETASVPLSSPAPATTPATAVDAPVPQQAGSAIHTPVSTKTHSPKRRTAAVRQAPQETVANIGAVSDALGSSGVMPQIEVPSPARTEEPADKPANIDESRPEVPVTAAAP